MDTETLSSELQKLKSFARTNDLRLEMAQGGLVYSGRMSVHTEHFASQLLPGRLLVVHEKKKVGVGIPPGQNMVIDYANAATNPRLERLRPANARALAR